MNNPMFEKIMEAYLEVAYREGVHNITLQKVAKRSKVSFGSVQKVLSPSINDPVDLALEYVGSKGYDYIIKYLEEHSGRKNNRIIEYFKGTFQWIIDCPTHTSFWLYFYYLGAISKRYKDLQKKFQQGAHKRIESLLYESIGNGSISKNFQVTEKNIKAIHHQIVGGCVALLQYESKEAQQEIIDAALENLNFILER